MRGEIRPLAISYSICLLKDGFQIFLLLDLYLFCQGHLSQFFIILLLFLLVFGTFFLMLAMKDAGWLCLVSVARTCLPGCCTTRQIRLQIAEIRR